MKKLLVSACAAVASASLMTNAAFATSVADLHHWKAVFVTPAHPQKIDPNVLGRLANANATIPFWRSSVKSPLDGKTYNYEMVGTSPFASPATTTVAYVPIVIKVKFANGVVLDPTKPGCNDTVSVQKRFFGGPLFHPVSVSSNGVAVGPAQLTDAFQRANWWTTIGGSSAYHVELKSALKAPIVITYSAPASATLFTGACSGSNHDLGAIDINTWDAEMQTLINKYATPTQLPVISSYNIVETEGGCCIIGYHNAYTRSSGEQTYSVGAYTDAGLFSGLEDIGAWSHEIGEWMDDPFVQTDGYNFTPAWGHTGQVSGCQNNLEVGDPLTGTQYNLAYKGFTYHPQELVFYSWFYRVAATGTGGKFSFNGTFTSAQGACT